MDVVSALEVFLFSVGSLAAILTGVFVVGALVSAEENREHTKVELQRRALVSGIVSLLSFLGVILIPEEETICRMAYIEAQEHKTAPPICDPEWPGLKSNRKE